MVYDASVAYPETPELLDRLDRCRASAALASTRSPRREALFGDTAAANFLLVGAAYQAGALPLPAAAIEEAIEINGVAVDANIAAFRWGRVAVADPAAFDAAVTGARPAPRAGRPRASLADTTFAGEVGDLLAAAGRAAGRLPEREGRPPLRRPCCSRSGRAERARQRAHRVQRGRRPRPVQAHRLQGRVRGGPAAHRPGVPRRVRRQVPGGEKLTYRLHPPLLRALGRKKKIGLGPRSQCALQILAKGKGLRGTTFDPFGYAHVRKVERDLLADYTDIVRRLAADLTRTTTTGPPRWPR